MIPGANTGDWMRPWYEQNLVVFDVETTGVHPHDDRIVELGIARFERGQLVATWGTLLHPGRDIPEEASAIHGIRNADVAQSPRLIAAVPKLLALTRDAWPCAYNALFDRTFWTNELRGLVGLDLSGISVPMFDGRFQWIDPVVWVRRKHGIWGGNKLGAACERKGISIESAHRATDDAMATGRLLYAMAADNEIPPYTVFELLRRQEALDRAHDMERAAWFEKKGLPYERRY